MNQSKMARMANGIDRTAQTGKTDESCKAGQSSLNYFSDFLQVWATRTSLYNYMSVCQNKQEMHLL